MAEVRHRSSKEGAVVRDIEAATPNPPSGVFTSPTKSEYHEPQSEHPEHTHHLHHDHNGVEHHHTLPHPHMPHPRKHRLPRAIHPDGESGRSGVHPVHFVRVCFNSSCHMSKYVNLLWPFVPAAIAVHFARPNDLASWNFALNYIAMVPTANLIGFAGQELARKLTKVFGVLLETFLGSIVEIILLMVLLVKSTAHEDLSVAVDHAFLVPVIRDAILGSILANLLLCLGCCFFAGGLRQQSQHFDAAVSEVGGGLLLTAGFGLAIPRAYYSAVEDQLGSTSNTMLAKFETNILQISRSTAVVLLMAFCIYVWFQMRSHHSLYDAVLEADEEKDLDRERDLAKSKLTLTECFVALGIALGCVSMHAVFLVEEIPFIIQQDNNSLSDMFLGLILVPLVEKASEHLTAIDEAWDNQMNFALAHVLGSTIQTALLNASMVVIVGWGLGKDMDLNFSTFQVILLILSILVVGNFIRDQESNYLEGALCILVYVIIAVAAFYFPNKPETGADGGEQQARMLARAVVGT